MEPRAFSAPGGEKEQLLTDPTSLMGRAQEDLVPGGLPAQYGAEEIVFDKNPGSQKTGRGGVDPQPTPLVCFSPAHRQVKHDGGSNVHQAKFMGRVVSH